MQSSCYDNDFIKILVDCLFFFNHLLNCLSLIILASTNCWPIHLLFSAVSWSFNCPHGLIQLNFSFFVEVFFEAGFWDFFSELKKDLLSCLVLSSVKSCLIYGLVVDLMELSVSFQLIFAPFLQSWETETVMKFVRTHAPSLHMRCCREHLLFFMCPFSHQNCSLTHKEHETGLWESVPFRWC